MEIIFTADIPQSNGNEALTAICMIRSSAKILLKS